MDSPIPEKKKRICTYSLLGLAFEKGKALQHKVLLIPGRKRRGFSARLEYSFQLG
jgi:hypothetical protein